MVKAYGEPHPLDAAAAIASRIAASALVADGHATWIFDECVANGDVVQHRARTLGAGLASGTAGVGWVLARVAAATGDSSVARVSAAATRHSLTSLDRLIADGDLGFHDGASGIAWAAVETDRALGGIDLPDTVRSAAARIAEAVRRQSAGDDREPGLARGLAGVVTGLVALSAGTRGTSELDAASDSVRALGDRVARWIDAGLALPRADVGLMNGASGIAAALLSWSDRRDDPAARSAAAAAFRLERAWHDDRAGWFGGDAVHPRSWSDGAAGIGLARVRAYASSREPVHLAEAGAAIETLRAVPAAEIHGDASLAHGAAGHVELLVSAGSIFAERAHAEAARWMLPRLLTACREQFPRGAVFDPTLMTGAAGVAVTLLRLHDPAMAESPLLPPLGCAV
jgi:lantibiotic modifying enzyme